ncbi:MAG TPA: DUF4369 domain-containing protein [Mucilaginibacter sp.]|nr:DUF4369 domain-containing protein [Mucilaginibacter sp.]
MNFLNQIIKAFLITISLIPMNLYAQQTNKSNPRTKIGYSITGHIKGLLEGEKVTMVLFNSKGYHNFERYLTVQDSGYVKDGVFHLTGSVPDGPRRYWMKFDKHVLSGKTIDLTIDNNENVTILSNISIDSIPHAYLQNWISIEGSPTNDSYRYLNLLQTLYFQNLSTLHNQIKNVADSVGFNGYITEGILTAINEINKTLYYNILNVTDKQDSRLKDKLSLAVAFNESGHSSIWMDTYNGLTDKQRNSFNGKWLKEISILTVGQILPEFSLPDPDGKLLNLKDIVKKGKLTIVHLWSANSDDRKIHQDEIRVMYKKYRDKGLNVIGLFHDDNYDLGISNKYTKINAHAQWKAILDSEGFPGYNVADLDVDNGIVEKVYREGGRNHTTNIILDSRGRIVAWDVQGAELQYYLWKTFGEQTN